MASRLTSETKNLIENRIAEIEKRTSLEFVPVLTDFSSPYTAWRIGYSLLALAGSLEYFLVHASDLSHFLKLGASIVAAVVTWFAFWIPSVRRFLVPKFAELRAVRDKAHQFFLSEEVFDTPLRTGILIFVSEFERAVYILADKGLASKVSDSEWKKLGETLAEDFSKKCPGVTFLEALDALAARLEPDFPPRAGINPQLANSVREVK